MFFLWLKVAHLCFQVTVDHTGGEEKGLHSCPVFTKQCCGKQCQEGLTFRGNRKEANKREGENNVPERKGWVSWVVPLHCSPTHKQTDREAIWAQFSRSWKAGRLPEVSPIPKHSVLTTLEKIWPQTHSNEKVLWVVRERLPTSFLLRSNQSKQEALVLFHFLYSHVPV